MECAGEKSRVVSNYFLQKGVFHNSNHFIIVDYKKVLSSNEKPKGGSIVLGAGRVICRLADYVSTYVKSEVDRLLATLANLDMKKYIPRKNIYN